MALSLISYLLARGIRRDLYANASISTIWRLGLGTINPLTIISWQIPSYGSTGLIANALVANLAQPILSLLYFLYNGLFTCMFAALEWSQYALHQKGTRVSAPPSGYQRNTSILQLPHRIALPLMAISGVLHWLVSQSIFLVNIEENGFGPDEFGGLSTMPCEYSPLAIILVLALGIFMIAFIVATGFKRFKSGMPIAASCSAAISAACHPVNMEDNSRASCAKVQ
jgi:hypothetical protein